MTKEKSPHCYLNDNALMIALAAIALLALSLWNALSLRGLIQITADDAFYYLEIAQNVIQGKGSTFDGIHLTNGYQPLWLFVLLPIFALFPSGGEIPFRLAFVLQSVLGALSAMVLYRLLRLGFRKTTSLLVSLVWISWGSRYFITGMETALYAFVLVITIWFWVVRFHNRDVAE